MKYCSVTMRDVTVTILFELLCIIFSHSTHSFVLYLHLACDKVLLLLATNVWSREEKDTLINNQQFAPSMQCSRTVVALDTRAGCLIAFYLSLASEISLKHT
jgi:hypothetical protein